MPDRGVVHGSVSRQSADQLLASLPQDIQLQIPVLTPSPKAGWGTTSSHQNTGARLLSWWLIAARPADVGGRTRVVGRCAGAGLAPASPAELSGLALELPVGPQSMAKLTKLFLQPVTWEQYPGRLGYLR